MAYHVQRIIRLMGMGRVLGRLIPGGTVKLSIQLPTVIAVTLFRRFRRRSQPGPKSILIIRLDGLGDCVMTLPLIDQVRRCLPDAQISVLTTPAGKAVFETSPSVNEVLVLQPLLAGVVPDYLPKLFGVLAVYWQSVRHRHFQIVLHPRWDADLYFCALLASLIRAPESVSYEDNTSPERRLLNQGFQRIWTRVLPAGPLLHEVMRNLAVGAALGCGEDILWPKLVVPDVQREVALKHLGPKMAKFVAIGLPAAEAKRRWSPASYVDMLRLVEAESSCVPVLFADEATEAAAQEIQRSIPSARIAFKVPFAELTALLAECEVFVGTDSGLGHVAAAVGCATVTISPHPATANPQHMNSPERFRPFTKRGVVVQPRTARTGCAFGCMSSVAHCILEVSADEVAESVLMLLREGMRPENSVE